MVQVAILIGEINFAQRANVLPSLLIYRVNQAEKNCVTTQPSVKRKNPMAKLIFKRFTCVTETDEVGSDSPYFLFFIGNTNPTTKQATSTVKMVREDTWDNNIDSGDSRDISTGDQTIATNVDSNTLVLVAVLEEDVNPDLVGINLLNVQIQAQAFFAFFVTTQNWNLPQLATKMKTVFLDIINSNLANDDMVNVARLTIPSKVGSIPTVHFFGDGGHYTTDFAIA